MCHSLDTKYRNEGKIGGPGEVIEVDETKFGRRKYNCGRYIERKWIIGMINISNDEFRLEIWPGERAGCRNSNTLLSVINILKEAVLR